MKHTLPPLAYDYAALEPHIDARTMLLHHDRHHAGYVDNLNTALLPHAELQSRSALWLLMNAAELPDDLRTTVKHNAGGHLNHSLYWRGMSPDSTLAPSGPLARAINDSFGSLDGFKTAFERAGAQVFGSGWVWLARAADEGDALQILCTPGHENPVTQGRYPLLVNDVWEHAYYLKHENSRAAFLSGWWPVVNWLEAERRFAHVAADRLADMNWEAEGGLIVEQAAA